jgi:putative transposase
MKSQLVADALHKALKQRECPTGIAFHSDPGSQYRSAMYRKIIADEKITQSMSDKANPYDNASMESFISTLKREQIQGHSFNNLEEANIVISDFMDQLL